MQRCPLLTVWVKATFTAHKHVKSHPPTHSQLLHNSPCNVPGEGSRLQGVLGVGVGYERRQTSFPVAFTYFPRTSPQTTGSATSPLSCPLSLPPPPATRELHRASALALHAGVRTCSIYRPRRRPRGARRAEPYPKHPPPEPSPPPGRSKWPAARRRRVQHSGERRVLAQHRGQRQPRGEQQQQQQLSRHRGQRRPRAQHRGQRPRSPHLAGQGHSCGSGRAPRGRRQPAAGGGTRRRSLITRGHTHTHAHTHTLTHAHTAGAAALLSLSLCSAGAAAAQRPPRSGAAVTWGTGTSKVLLLLLLLPPPPPPPLLAESGGQGTAAAAELAAAPGNEIRQCRRAGQEEKCGLMEWGRKEGRWCERRRRHLLPAISFLHLHRQQQGDRLCLILGPVLGTQKKK